MGLSITDIFPALGNYVARNRAKYAKTALGDQPEQLQQLLGAPAASTMGMDDGGLISGISTPGSGLMADPQNFQNQAQFAGGLMGLPAYQGAGQQFMGQAMANQMGLPMELLRMTQQQGQSDRRHAETQRKNNMGPATQQMIEFATNPNTPPLQAAMMQDYLKKSDGVTVNMPNVDENKNAAFASEAVQASTDINAILDTGYLPGHYDQVAWNVPIVGNSMVSDEYRKYRNAAAIWIQANLRPVTGALIGVEEEEEFFNSHFPQPGDTEADAKAKKLYRDQKLQSRLIQAGRAEGKVKAVGGAGTTPPSLAAPATSESGNVQPPANAKPVSTKKKSKRRRYATRAATQ